MTTKRYLVTENRIEIYREERVKRDMIYFCLHVIYSEQYIQCYVLNTYP